MTMGERIQELRKAKGLSQEALGEALGVTRQAVSRWESDGAIPEVDKLVALSRLFGVPVGVLLGVEEPAAEGEVPEELTDREWRAVEAVVSRYLAEAEARRSAEAEPPRPRKRRWPRVLGWAALAVCAAVCVAVTAGQFRELRESIRQVQNNVSGITTQVNGQIGSIAAQVEELLKEQSDLTARSGYQIAELTKDTCLLQLSAAPKQYTEGMSACFVAEGPDFEAVRRTAQVDGTTFFCEMEVPLSDQIDLSVVFNDGTEQRTQALESIFNLKSDSQLQVWAAPSGTSRLRNGTLELEWDLGIDCFSVGGDWGGAAVSPVAMSIRRYRNGGMEEELPVDLSEWAPWDGAWTTSVPYRRELPVQAGDRIDLVLRITDSYDRTYDRLVDRMRITAQGKGNLELEFDTKEVHMEEYQPQTPEAEP